MTTRQLIPQTHVDGKYLGRHIEHDPLSFDFPAAQATKVKSVMHARHGSVFNQGNIGSCTGNAMAGLLMTDPIWVPGRELTEEDALAIYELGTKLDGFPGDYPPDDTGSSGLGVARAARKMGEIKTYRHAFGIDQALRALTLRPTISGVPWYSGFDEPDADGLVQISGSIRGGHEFVQVGIDVDNWLVWNDNSWDTSWGVTGPEGAFADGVTPGGMFCFTFDTWAALLKQQGDVLTAH